MPNSLATLRGYLETQLRDSAAPLVWSQTEKENLLTWATAGLYPRIARPIDPSAAAAKITMVANTYYYSMPTGMLEAFRIDWVAADDTENGPISGAAWEIVGDAIGGAAKIHVSPRLIEAGDTLRVHGYGRYDLTTNYPPDDYVPLILAKARAEAVRRVLADRERFKTWLSRNQSQNVSVNELLQMVNEADNEALRLQRQYRTPRKPVRGRIG